MTETVKRNDQIEMEWTFKSELLESRSFFFVQAEKKKRNKTRLIRKMKNCNFVGTMILLKREIAKKIGSPQNTKFS